MDWWAQVLQVSGLAGRPDVVLWDTADPTVFVVAAAGQLHVYVHTAMTMNGRCASSSVLGDSLWQGLRCRFSGFSFAKEGWACRSGQQWYA
jgi:hypothetical protein